MINHIHLVVVPSTEAGLQAVFSSPYICVTRSG